MTYSTTEALTKAGLLPGTDLIIVARSWVDIYGNTYHSRRVWLDGQRVTEAESNFCYGYGDHYLTEAAEALAKAGLLPGYDGGALWRHCEDNGISLFCRCDRVRRKRDLHDFGRKS
jgi:hypothetical protein